LKEDGVSEEARSLLTGLLEKDPAKRMTVPQILSHKWLIDANDKMELFTDQEREYIKNEFTYNDTERYNRNDDPFTDHMLDSTNNSMLKNNETKSVILAPFNSTKSDINAKAITEDMKVLIQSKGCIKFAPRCREIDKQYENNNNADLDNGVYHK
jgi:serine/threonine protein kinase